MISINKNIEKVIKLADRHKVYFNTVKYRFDYFFDAVESTKEKISEDREIWTVDYSEPAFHKVIGYERDLIHFPSTAEPLFTTQQYLDFAKLKKGDTVIDLGCYSGLTSILFKDEVGEEGRVIGVDADVNNIFSITTNLNNYTKSTGRHIEFLHSAIWKHDDGIEFSCEGNMGASSIELLAHLKQDRKAEIVKVPSITLDSLVKKFNITSVNFLKCDVEGAEWVIFNDSKFFELTRPKMFIELHPHRKDLNELVNGLKQVFEKYNYECQVLTTEELDTVMLCQQK